MTQNNVLVFFYSFFRTKALVLELLAAICLVKGGHEIILSAFDNFKEVCHEARRFQTLMDYFINYEVFHVEFMVRFILLYLIFFILLQNFQGVVNILENRIEKFLITKWVVIYCYIQNS